MMSSANVVPEGNNWVYTYELPNTEEKSSAVRYYLQVNNDSTPVQARLLLLAHIINEPFFCALRTKDNLGYEVSSAPWVQGGVVGMLFMVQSERSTVLVENKIEGFLADFEGNTLTPMKDFESQRNALVEKLREKPENLDQESVRFAFTILSGRRNSQNYYDFDLRTYLSFRLCASTILTGYHRRENCGRDCNSRQARINVVLQRIYPPPSSRPCAFHLCASYVVLGQYPKPAHSPNSISA